MEQLNKNYNVAKELEDYLQKVTYTAGLDKDIEKIEIIVNPREQSAEIVITTDSHTVVNSILNILAKDRISDKYKDQLAIDVLFVSPKQHHM
jgi:hypothetical protein